MENRKITINEACRAVNIPPEVSMRSFEIAHLFCVTSQAVNANIASLMKAGIVHPEMKGYITMKYGMYTPEYFGLDIVTALAFRLDSFQAKIFREWVLNRIVCRKEAKDVPIFITLHDEGVTC